MTLATSPQRTAVGFLPNLLVIGAAKCGTTSLHHYLDQHPQVAMSAQKELRLFWRPDWQERLDWYRHQFPIAALVRGESTPAYSFYPARPHVPERVHSLIPDVRLVYVVRDPIDRLVSHWAQARADSARRNFKTPVSRMSFEEAVGNPEAPESIVWASRYATQLERYLKFFSDSQMLVLDYDDLSADREGTLRRVFRFLGIDDELDLSTPAFSERLNTRADKQELTRLGAPVWNHLLWPLGHRLPRPLRQRLARPARRVVERPVQAPREIHPALRDRLETILGPEVARLRALTGIPFSSWSV